MVETAPDACSSDSDEESAVNLRAGQRKRQSLEGKTITLNGALTHIEASAIEKKTRTHSMRVVNVFLAFLAAWRLPLMALLSPAASVCRIATAMQLMVVYTAVAADGWVKTDATAVVSTVAQNLNQILSFSARVKCSFVLKMIKLRQRSMALFTLMNLSG